MTAIDLNIKQQLREHDTDRYIATFFAPSDKRQDLIYLYAFNQELEKIPFSVSEPMLGEIRLQWWRDVLNKASNEREQTGNPIADNMMHIIDKYSLPIKNIQELIDARSFELSEENMPDMGSLMIYFRKTYGSLFKLSAKILSSNNLENIEGLSREAGNLYGLTQSLVKLPYHSSAGICYLPMTKIEEYFVDLGSIFKGETSSALDNLLIDLRTNIAEQNEALKQKIVQLPDEMIPAFLPMTITDTYLKKLSKKNHNHLRDIIQINPIYRLWKYWHASAFGNI